MMFPLSLSFTVMIVVATSFRSNQQPNKQDLRAAIEGKTTHVDNNVSMTWTWLPEDGEVENISCIKRSEVTKLKNASRLWQKLDSVKNGSKHHGLNPKDHSASKVFDGTNWCVGLRRHSTKQDLGKFRVSRLITGKDLCIINVHHLGIHTRPLCSSQFKISAIYIIF